MISGTRKSIFSETEKASFLEWLLRLEIQVLQHKEKLSDRMSYHGAYNYLGSKKWGGA